MTDTTPAGGSILCDLEENPIPEGARAGYFLTSDRIRLRYALWPKLDGPRRGTICLVQGRTEFIEKYFETIDDFRRRGFGVATFDWRGQGGSQRLIRNPTVGYVETFDDYVTDLMSFHRNILLPDCPPPFNLVAHSMGGLVALMAAARDRLIFERAFLSAPLLGIDGMPLSTARVASLAEGLGYLGLGSFPVGRGGDDFPSEDRFAGNVLTSDFRRYMVSVEVYAARPDLRVGKPSIKWSAAAFRAMAEVAQFEFAASVKVPVLMLAAARDQVVSTAAIEHMGLSMRTGRHVVIPTARHELFVENDAIRDQVFAAFDAFITEPSG